MLENSGYVYLIQAVGTNRYKIGRTKNPQRRLENLKQQSPFPLKLLEISYSDNYVAEENRLHRLASKYRSHGEWFDLPGWWLEHVNDWFHNHKCHKYVEVGKQSKIIRYVESSLTIPSSYDDFQRVLGLLGDCAKGGGLKSPKTRAVLTELIGASPTDKTQAASWKKQLRDQYKEIKRQPPKPHGIVV